MNMYSFDIEHIVTDITVKFNLDDVIQKSNKLVEKFSSSNFPGMELRKQEILDVAPDVDRIINVLRKSSYINAILALWLRGDAATGRVPLTQQILDHITYLSNKTRSRKLGPFSLRTFCIIFFQEYDKLTEFEYLAHFISHHLNKYLDSQLSSELLTLKQYSRILISKTGHQNLELLSRSNSRTIVKQAKLLGIPTQSRFYSLALREYFLVKIKSVRVNENAEILNEALEPDFYNCRVSSGWRIGHDIITSLIDILLRNHVKPSDQWLDILLTIAGDPRVASSSPSYITWWAPLAQYYVDAMLVWLAEVDMSLFLRIMRDFAPVSGDPDLVRQYPLREKFLRVLFEKNLVLTSRLYLGSHAADFVKSVFKENKKHLPVFYNIIDNRNRSIFYLNLSNKAHFVEGTHNFAAYIFSKLPENSPFKQKDRFDFYNRSLGKGHYELYKSTYADNLYLRKVHIGDWRYDLINMFQNLGLSVTERDFYTKDEFNKIHFASSSWSR